MLWLFYIIEYGVSYRKCAIFILVTFVSDIKVKRNVIPYRIDTQKYKKSSII